MELHTVIVEDLDEEVRRWQVEAAVDVSAEQHPLAVFLCGDGVSRSAPPRAGDDEPLILHDLELRSIHGTGDPTTPHLLIIRRRQTRCRLSRGRGRCHSSWRNMGWWGEERFFLNGF